MLSAHQLAAVQNPTGRHRHSLARRMQWAGMEASRSFWRGASSCPVCRVLPRSLGESTNCSAAPAGSLPESPKQERVGKELRMAARRRRKAVRKAARRPQGGPPPRRSQGGSPPRGPQGGSPSRGPQGCSSPCPPQGGRDGGGHGHDDGGEEEVSLPSDVPRGPDAAPAAPALRVSAGGVEPIDFRDGEARCQGRQHVGKGYSRDNSSDRKRLKDPARSQLSGNQTDQPVLSRAGAQRSTRAIAAGRHRRRMLRIGVQLRV